MPINQVVKLADLQSHPKNYNGHDAAQVAKLAASLTAFGQVRSIVVWRGTILAGHGVVLAARSLGWTELRADVVDELDEARALAYVVADNELARQSDPDLAQLAAILIAVGGGVWRFSAALRGFESRVGRQVDELGARLEVLAVRLEHASEAQSATAGGLSEVRRAEAELRDRVTRLEERVKRPREA
jgi:ParB-like chromosome segregation protein Spo0J